MTTDGTDAGDVFGESAGSFALETGGFTFDRLARPTDTGALPTGSLQSLAVATWDRKLKSRSWVWVALNPSVRDTVRGVFTPWLSRVRLMPLVALSSTPRTNRPSESKRMSPVPTFTLVVLVEATVVSLNLLKSQVASVSAVLSAIQR